MKVTPEEIPEYYCFKIHETLKERRKDGFIACELFFRCSWQMCESGRDLTTANERADWAFRRKKRRKISDVIFASRDVG